MQHARAAVTEAIRTDCWGNSEPVVAVMCNKCVCALCLYEESMQRLKPTADDSMYRMAYAYGKIAEWSTCKLIMPNSISHLRAQAGTSHLRAQCKCC